MDEALKNNPRLRAAKFRQEAADARVRLLRTLDDPKFEYEYNKVIPRMVGRNAPMRMYSVSQAVPFPTKLILRKQAARKEADAFKQDHEELSRKIIQEVKEAFFRLFLSHKKAEVAKENLELLSRFIEVANKKYAAGQAKQSDVLRAQVEYSKLSNQLVLFDQEAKIAEAMLCSLLSRPPDVPVEIMEEIPGKGTRLDEEGVLRLAKEHRPELRAFADMAGKAQIGYSLAKEEYLPDLMFKYTRQVADGQAGAWTGMVGVTIPLWFWEKQNSFVKEARADLEEARAEYAAAEDMVLFEARSAFARYAAADRLTRIYETGVLPQAKSSLETARIGYESGQVDFLDLLDSLRSLKDFELEYFESLANQEIALADLERSVGTDLPEQSEGNDEK